jgi:uncharacterized protein YbjT (DUF2867 family)
LRDVDTLFVVSNNPALELGAVDAAIRQGVRRIVKSSAVGFRDQPPPGHREVEIAIRHSGLVYTILRALTGDYHWDLQQRTNLDRLRPLRVKEAGRPSLA